MITREKIKRLEMEMGKLVEKTKLIGSVGYDDGLTSEEKEKLLELLNDNK